MKRRALGRVLAAAVAVALGGCAPAPYRAKVVTLSSSCLGSWTQLKPDAPFVPNAEQQEVPRQEFADHAVCLGPPALPAPTSVVLYDLGTVGRPAQLQVSLPVATGGTLAGRVEVLDADFHTLGQHGFGEFERRGAAYTLPVFLRDDAPRYLALLPDAQYVGKEVSTIGSHADITTVPTAYGTFMVAHGQEVKQTIPLMAGGQVSVLVVSSPLPVGHPATTAP